MIADAEAHRAEDARIRAEVDARNELDAVVHQVERRLTELGDQVPVHEKARAENLDRGRPQGHPGAGPARPSAHPERRAAAGVPRPRRQPGSGRRAADGAVGGR